MFRKVLTLTTFILILSTCQVQAATTVSWDGGGDGYSWGDANNWNPNIVPDGDFDVIINDTGYVGIELKQDRTINQLDCYGKVKFERWNPYWVQIAFSDPNGFTNHGNLESWPNYELYGNVTNCAGATIYFQNIAINEGDLRNPEGAEISIGGELDVAGHLSGGGIINSGDIIVEPPAGEFGADDILDNNSTGIIKGSGAVSSDKMIRNQGQIIASGGTLTVLSEGSVTNRGTLVNEAVSTLNIRPANDVNNQGLIEVNAGGGVAFDCNLVNVADANINLLGGTLAAKTITQSAGATFAGFGGITGDVVIDPNGIIELTGSTNIVGDVSISPNATLEISDGVTLITGQTTCNGTIHIKGGYLIPQGGFSGDCNIIWEPGTYTNVADFNLDGEVNFGDFAYFAETWLWQTSWH